MSIFKKLFSSKDNKQSDRKIGFSEGDIFYVEHDNKFYAYKLLVFDREFDCYHVLGYIPLDNLPQNLSIGELEVQVYHTPIARGGFVNPVFILNQKVNAADLVGYHEYLRETQGINNYLNLANEYYQNALLLTDQKKHLEAIDSYSKAIDLIPDFFEAIDNRAFCKMDLGLWAEAIEGFRESLGVNPDTFLAEFSIGECYLRLKDYEKAKDQFEKALAIDPNSQAAKDFLKRTNELLAAV